MNAKNIVISGGTGFLGSNVINMLKEGYIIYNLGRNKNPLCNNVYWDLEGEIDYSKLPKKVDIIIHAASIVGITNNSPSKYIDINVKSTTVLLEYALAASADHYIYISTGGVYGFKDKLQDEDEYCNPKDFYGLTKYFSEMACNYYKDKIPMTVLRLFFPYGVKQIGRLIPNLVEKIMSNDIIEINKSGKPAINPIYIDDATYIIKQIIDNKIYGTYNICGNEIVSIKDICNIIAKKLNKTEIAYCENNNCVEDLIGSNKKISKVVNLKNQISINSGIDKIIAYKINKK